MPQSFTSWIKVHYPEHLDETSRWQKAAIAGAAGLSLIRGGQLLNRWQHQQPTQPVTQGHESPYAQFDKWELAGMSGDDSAVRDTGDGYLVIGAADIRGGKSLGNQATLSAYQVADRKARQVLVRVLKNDTLQGVVTEKHYVKGGVAFVVLRLPNP